MQHFCNWICIISFTLFILFFKTSVDLFFGRAAEKLYISNYYTRIRILFTPLRFLNNLQNLFRRASRQNVWKWIVIGWSDDSPVSSLLSLGAVSCVRYFGRTAVHCGSGTCAWANSGDLPMYPLASWKFKGVNGNLFCWLPMVLAVYWGTVV